MAHPSMSTKHTEQHIANKSYDETYEEQTVEILGEDVVNGVLRRIQVDSSGNIITSSTSGTQDVNLTKVADSAVATGHGTASGAIRVELPTDGTGVVGLAAGSAVIGHVIADTGSTTAVTGNVTVVQPTGTNLHTVVDSGTVAATQSGTWTVQPGNTANTTAWKVDGSAVTQPVSGTVTANAGTDLNTSLLALESGGNLASIKTNTDKIPSQGQALAAASMPVVLTAAQLATLTPTAAPSAISAFVTAVATAGVRVQLASNTVSGVILQAPSTNTGLIYVGGSAVSSSVYGAELQPGQATSVAVNNTNLVYIDASANGDKCAALAS